MVQTLVTLDGYENKVVNLVMAALNLKSKNEAIEFIIREKGEDILEEELRPEFIAELKAGEAEKPMGIKDFKELRKRLEA